MRLTLVLGARDPLVLAQISSENLNRFLSFHPALYELLLRELVAQYNVFCGTIRLLGLDTSVQHRLARLLLYWCDANGEAAHDGVRISVAMTHEEIGQFIGASRETVTRVISGFRERRLIEIHGATILVPDLASLALFATA